MGEKKKERKPLSKKQKILIAVGIVVILLSAGITTLVIVVRHVDIPDLPEYDFPSSGRTIIVDHKGGGDFVNISSAITRANDGDLIRIYSGTYLENIVIDKTLWIIGNGTETTNIIGNYKKPTAKFITGAMYSIIEHITVRTDDFNDEGYRRPGIEIATSNIVIQNCYLKHNEIGINVKGKGNVIQNCICESNNFAGIEISSDSNYVYYNVVNNNEFYGINVNWFSDENAIIENEVKNNHIGIHVDNSAHDNIIAGNICSNKELDIEIETGDTKLDDNEAELVDKPPSPIWTYLIVGGIFLLLVFIIATSIYLFFYYSHKGHRAINRNEFKDENPTTAVKMKKDLRKTRVIFILVLIVFIFFLLLTISSIAPLVLSGFDIEGEKYLCCCGVTSIIFFIPTAVFGSMTIVQFNLLKQSKIDFQEAEIKEWAKKKEMEKYDNDIKKLNKKADEKEELEEF